MLIRIRLGYVSLLRVYVNVAGPFFLKISFVLLEHNFTVRFFTVDVIKPY